MTGLDSDQLDWLYEQVDALVDWDLPVGRPRALPLYTALVLVLFGLRHNLAPDVIGEVFGCGSTTVERYQEELEPLVDMVLTPLYERVRDRARRDAVLVDGLVVPVGERDGVDGLFSEKKGFCGQNVQVVANLAGRVVDVGDPCPGGMHDRKAFDVSGIAARWAGHHAPGGPGMIGDKGYQGAGIVSPYKKPRGRELTEVRRACNTALNRLRAAVERAVAHLKCWKVLKTGFRRSLEHFPATLRTVTKLEIFRIYGLR
ncbi:transposase family protein [Micromonospora sp. LOL_015]|uniref:transposase family protein n=1 Tax=Micromonospora sp. LOL_015 TaxID=3345416 RepID=UPI003A860412